VRGDSRRDLYSKTLALCGLGVLAGAGALVDYWPVGVRFPAAASPVFGVSAATLSPSSDPAALAVLAGLLDAPRRTAPAQPTARRTEPVPVIMTYESLPTMDVVSSIGMRVDVEALPAPAFVNVRHDVPTLPGAQVHLTAPALDRELDDRFSRAAADCGGGGFITSAFRKTGSSIVRTGVKTGTSLVGAVRVLGSAVRRALPD
jgi:hypothetical protein